MLNAPETRIDCSLVAALPLAMLKPLLMRTSQKIELAIIFSLGGINMLLTILRTVYSLDVVLAKFPDQNLLWCFLQATVAVIVCALPCYRGILKRNKSDSMRANDLDTSELEFADIWQRYLISIGEHNDGSGTDNEKDIEPGKISGSSGTQTRTSELSMT